MQADFSGWASKADIKCSDGRTINAGAFKHQHMTKVPLVWQHGHKDPENVLGHVLLENREEGVYAYAFFNPTPKAQHSKAAVEHGDINRLSIWANELVQKSGRVLHGAIREVSLVLAGANPGAVIDNIAVRHGDEIFEDEAIIHTDLPIEHEQPTELPEEDQNKDLKHASDDGSGENKDDKDDKDGGPTVQDVYESLTEEQKKLVHHMIGEAIASTKSDENDDEDDEKGEAKHGNTDGESNNDENNDEKLSHEANDNKEGSDMGTSHNLFEGTNEPETKERLVLSHSDVHDIMETAQQVGSLRKALYAYAQEHLEHGIVGLEALFPDAKAATTTPEWDKRRTEWVEKVLNGASKRPYSRIKSWTADITFEEARAKGYIKGNMKKEEWFSIAKRETGPQTVYKKQKLDRDDIIDITDFDVVVWVKGEMRLMLREECARAVLVGDNREVDDPDRIDPSKIRPIAFDHPYYTTTVAVDVSDSVEQIVDSMILSRENYKGTGSPTFYTTQGYLSRLLLARDEMGRKIYKSKAELVADMDVEDIVPVEILNEYPAIIGVLVNMADYTIGTDRGGEVTTFEDFDIDFNQEKYLIETRMSGALMKPASAQVFTRANTAATAVVPEAPSWDSSTGELTINDTTGVVYKDGNGTTLTEEDSPYEISAGDTVEVYATPTSTSYFIAPGARSRWTYLANPELS